MKKYICIDIGGTAVKYGIINEEKKFLYASECPTHAHKGGKYIMSTIFDLTENMMTEYQPEGICVSTAGMVDVEKGEISYASSLIPGYTGMPVKRMLEEKFHILCEVENDVNCAGLAEYYAGASKGSKISVCLTIGTGIGGSFILDGNVFRGFSGSACEIGYMNLPGGMFQDQGASRIMVKKVAQLKDAAEQEMDGKYIFEKAKQGDKDCVQAIDEMADILGMGIANICYMVNPEIVVLGGGIMAQKEYLKDKIEGSLKKYLIPAIEKNTRIKFAENQNHAGMLGAYFHFIKQQEIRNHSKVGLVL